GRRRLLPRSSDVDLFCLLTDSPASRHACTIVRLVLSTLSAGYPVVCELMCLIILFFFFFFFFQAEDGIRDWSVTGVQTCALPIWPASSACSATLCSCSA